MIVKLITAPILEPVTLAEVKTQVRVYNTDSDVLLQSFLNSSVLQAEDQMGRVLLSQAWAVIFDSWTEMTARVLPKGQLASVASIKYNDEDGAEQTVSTDDYLVYGVGTDAGKIIIHADSDFDYPDLYEKDPITVTYVCGYASVSLVPEIIKTGIKLLVEGVFHDTDVENAVAAHLNSHRIWTA